MSPDLIETIMRSICPLIFSCFLLSINTEGQNEVSHKPFSVIIDAGPAIQQTRTGGGVIEFNPGYMFASRYRAGIQLAWAGFNDNTVASHILTLDYYYFQNRRLRLSVGAGYGFYSNSIYSCQLALPPEEKLIYRSTGKMGVNVRMGLEWRHLVFRIDYHFAPDLYEYSSYNNDPPATSIFKGNYLGLTIGIRIGGG